MEKYLVKYSFDEDEKKFVVVCPKFFGLMFYCETLEEVKKNSLKLLRIYAKNKDLSGKNIILIKNKEKEVEIQI